MRATRKKGVNRATIAGEVFTKDIAPQLLMYAVINMDLYQPLGGSGRIWLFDSLADALDMARLVTLSRLPRFLDVVSEVFNGPNPSKGDDERSFIRTILGTLGMSTAEPGVISYITNLAALGVISYDKESKREKLAMTRREFEQRYGVRLPTASAVLSARP